MNLKKLEAYGFKSFADKLTLTFNSGVTCIVGPNGCGKSNVSDAIRWVLGEQSPKNLRGKSMQEVIFNGTASRKALGYCEVSLYFDNTNRTYDIDNDEVIIKRKLYRSGDSEYYINNDPCRLRDILDLFRDTGIGKDGYSVVGQGKIDSFLSAKPEDRRQIFEEAAGISKHRARRAETQRKLDRSSDQLLRVKDELTFYEEVMRPLEVQAKEALKARELKEQLKYNEINHFVYLTEHNAEERNKIVTRLEQATRSLAEAEKDAARLEREFAKLQEDSKNWDGEYKRLSDEKLTVSIRISTKNGKNDLNLQKLEQIKAELSRLEGEISQKSAAINDHTASREANIRERETVFLDIRSAKQAEEEINKRVTEVEEAVAWQRKEIDVTNEMRISSADQMGQISSDISKVKTEIGLLEKRLEENTEELNEKRREFKENEKKLADCNAEIERLQADRAEKKAFKKDVDDQYGEKLEAVEDSQDRYGEIKATIANLTTRIEMLEHSKNNYGNFDGAVRFLMNSKDPCVKEKILGVVGTAISTAPQFSTAIEVALGGNINNMITADQRDTSFLIDYLNQNRGGRGTFLPLTAMRPRPLEDKYLDALDADGCYGIAADLVKYERRFRPAIETLLGRVVVVDTKETAIKMAQRYSNAFRIVTLDGAHYAINGAVSGGQQAGRDSGTLRVEADITEAKRRLAAKQRDMEVILAEMNEGKAALKEMETTSRVLSEIIAKIEKDIAATEKNCEYLNREAARLKAETDRLSESVNSDKREISHKQMALASVSEQEGSTSSKRVDINDQLIRLTAELKEKERERDGVVAERTDIILKLRQLDNKLTEMEKNIDLAARNIDRLNGEILEGRSRTKILEAEAARITEEVERIAAEQTDDEELKTIQEALNGLDQMKWEIEKRQNSLHFEEKRTATLIKDQSARKAKAEGDLERIETEMRQVGEKVHEEYGLDYDAAAELKDVDYDDERGVQSAKLLRRELAKMGDINEKAVEDLAEKNAAYQEKKVHYDDLTKAIADLESTIKDLTADMEKRFAESFAQIKLNFAEVFTELFGGGRGMLDLELSKDTTILEAGINISAEPPGKRLQNIDLLSGGERAMTAIALIFAIIKLHPMPFCVLDEVDAPLDDANADTYAMYLKKFSKETQFIIVSHRKPTMERADELYGITMQEKGVSKFFNVKLSEALAMVKQ